MNVSILIFITKVPYIRACTSEAWVRNILVLTPLLVVPGTKYLPVISEALPLVALSRYC